jgi:protein TonB
VRRAEVSPAALGSVALHGTILVALLISWRFGHDLKIGSAVPVNIVANAPETNLREAEQAAQVQSAQTETPVAEAPPQAAPPPAQPAPTPPAPAPIPAKPAPTPTPTPAKAQKPAKPEKSLDLAALDASLAKSATKPAPAKPSSATQGPARQETALQSRPALGTGNSAAAVSGLADELQRRWNPNCDVQGGRDVLVKATFQLGAGGNVVGEVATEVVRGQGNVAQAAAARARSAVFAAAPFRSLPREFYGERISVNFNAREACP